MDLFSRETAHLKLQYTNPCRQHLPSKGCNNSLDADCGQAEGEAVQKNLYAASL